MRRTICAQRAPFWGIGQIPYLYFGGMAMKRFAERFNLIARQTILVLADILLINLAFFFIAVVNQATPFVDLLPMLLSRAIPVTAAYLLVFGFCGTMRASMIWYAVALRAFSADWSVFPWTKSAPISTGAPWAISMPTSMSAVRF